MRKPPDTLSKDNILIDLLIETASPTNPKIPTFSFSFKDKSLERLYYNCDGKGSYPESVVRAFFKVMTYISSATSLRDLYELKGVRPHKLKGKRQDQISLSLNGQWRLIAENTENSLLIVGITCHYD
jgi:plasmid maintenance system killer protein